MSKYCNVIGSISEASKHIGKHTEAEFRKSLYLSGSILDNETFDMEKYALYYCEQDVRVLAKCVRRFAVILKEQFDLNLFDFISISSLSKAVQMKEGCFENCPVVIGILR